MAKKIIAVLMALTMIFSLCACRQSEDEKEKKEKANTLDSSDSDSVDSESIYEELPVAEGAIASQGNLNESIKWTYYENGFLLIEGSGNMPSLPHDYGEKEWSNVKAAKIGEGITSVGDSCFSYCNYLISVELPESIELINAWAFYYCADLKEINIPENVTEISRGAFVGTDSLAVIEIPAKVENFGRDSFTSFGYSDGREKYVVDPENPYFMSDENGVLYTKDGTELIIYPAGNELKEFKVPQSVVSIDDDAFLNAKNLDKLIIPINVTYVGRAAFSDMEESQTIYIEFSKNYTDVNWNSSWSSYCDAEIVYDYND